MPGRGKGTAATDANCDDELIEQRPWPGHAGVWQRLACVVEVAEAAML